MSADAIEAILADFRAWLTQAKEIPAAEPAEQLDVATVVQHFTALRQEVNLQTKASRAHLEQTAQTIASLQQALEAIEQPAETPPDDELLRPLLKALVDAHDALSLAEREVNRQLANAPSTTAGRSAGPPAVHIKLPYWARWFGLDVSVEAQLAPLRAWADTQARAPGDQHRQALDALLVGYRMSLQRLERALEQQELEVIACVGQAFDPETMEVAEVTREEGRASTEVVQEVRRGYRWRGRLFRYAQVRVAKP